MAGHPAPSAHPLHPASDPALGSSCPRYGFHRTPPPWPPAHVETMLGRARLSRGWTAGSLATAAGHSLTKSPGLEFRPPSCPLAGHPQPLSWHHAHHAPRSRGLCVGAEGLPLLAQPLSRGSRPGLREQRRGPSIRRPRLALGSTRPQDPACHSHPRGTRPTHPLRARSPGLSAADLLTLPP